SAAASLAGLIPHLPWILALAVFPPAVNLASYVPASSDPRTAINPTDALRLIGYVTPFVEMSVRSWYQWWFIASFVVLIVSILGLLRIPAARGIPVVAIVALVLIYQAGQSGPGFSEWWPRLPLVIQATFRERYHL